MMKPNVWGFLLWAFLAAPYLHAQAPVVVGATQLQDKSLRGGVPQSVLHYAVGNESIVRLLIQPNHRFSCFGIGWQSSQQQTDLSLFSLRYRTLSPTGVWSDWKSTEADHRPEDTPTGMFWTEATFTHDASSHDQLELEVTCPTGVTGIKVDLFDGNFQSGEKAFAPQTNELPSVNSSSVATCTPFPTITTRAQWCGGSAPCTQVTTAYTPTYITPTHIVIHHGASPDTYTDGRAVVQSYYNYHVNTLGWTDIGYNFLVDKNGIFYQGRHNPNLTTADVRGAHAGNANSGSIGVNFPGNADVTLATTAQLNVVNQLLAWWFERRGLDPTTSASMTTQAYGVQVQPRICGHRDIGQTTCPGNDLYGRLPAMRTAVKQIMDNCACAAPTGLTASSITSSSAVLAWSATASATSYNIQYKTSAATTWTSTTSTTNSLTLTGLAGNTTYQFKVQPVCSGATNPAFSTTASFTTLVTCNAPTGLTASSITSSGATLSWTAVSGAANYTVEYKTSAATTWTSTTVTTTSTTLTGLAASTTYNYRIRTVCSNNTSVYSTTTSFTTLAPSCGVTTSLNTSNITTTGVTLGWTAVSGASSYTIRYRKSGVLAWTTTTSTTNSKAITGLTHTSTYEFQVQTVCGTTSSAFSGSRSFTTATPPDMLVQIGNGTQAYSGHPYATGLSDERTQYIVTAAELAAAGWSASNPYLSSISFQVSTAAAQTMNNFTISISHTTNSAYSSANYLTGTTTTSTYTGNVTAVAGWNTYTFSTPFNFNNTQNLLITICWDNTTFTSHSIVPTTILSTYQAIFNRSNVAAGNLCSTSTGTLSFYRPNMRFNFRAVPQSALPQADEQVNELVLVESVEPDDMPQLPIDPTFWQVEEMPAGESVLSLDASSDFQLYPNPFQQQIRIVAEGEWNDRTVRLSSLLGNTLLLAEMPETNVLELDLSHLPAGMYFISGGTKTKTLIKE